VAVLLESASATAAVVWLEIVHVVWSSRVNYGRTTPTDRSDVAYR